LASAIEGRLADAYVRVVEEYLGQFPSTSKELVVYLKSVIEVDATGRSLLARLIAGGVRLRAAGVYTQHLVEELKVLVRAHRSVGSGRLSHRTKPLTG